MLNIRYGDPFYILKINKYIIVQLFCTFTGFYHYPIFLPTLKLQQLQFVFLNLTTIKTSQITMGNCNPKPQKPLPPQKDYLQLCCKRLKYHLEIKQLKINQQIIAGESQLVTKIKVNQNQRNKFDELLLAERIVNGLKYTTVYSLLMEYANSIGSFANFICENINDQKKLQQWHTKVYSIMYAADKIPLDTLKEFKKCMNYIENQILIEQHADLQIKKYLTPHPTPYQMNVYILQMSQRNNILLEKINQAGHQFSVNFKPKPWDNQFNQKSSQYRDSLPRDMITGRSQKNLNHNVRSSISNPFDKGKLIQSKKIDLNAQKQIGSNSNQKLDSNDVSPNITDLMRKIGKSGER